MLTKLNHIFSVLESAFQLKHIARPLLLVPHQQCCCLGRVTKVCFIFPQPRPPTSKAPHLSFQSRVTVSFATMADNRYCVGYAKMGTSSCKKCKQKIDKGALRIGKVTPNPFSDEGGDMKQWFHPICIFETFKRARATTKKIEDPGDLEDFTDLKQEDKDLVNKIINEFWANTKKPTPKKKAAPVTQSKLPFSPSKPKEQTTPVKLTEGAGPSTSTSGRDDLFRELRRLCADIAEENSYTGKTALVAKYLRSGSSGDGYQGDTYLLMKLLLPGVVKSVYNLNNKQLVKLFSQIFSTRLEEMVEDLNQGDVAETVKVFFEQSKILAPQKKSFLTLQMVDSYLEELAKVTKEDDQQYILTKIAKRCTANDLKMVIRLIKHDLRINAGAKHILDGLDENAYAAFQASRDLKDVVNRVLANKNESGKPGMSKKLSVRASLMTPVLPMLAEACRSVEQAMKKCPNGFYAEIKYDGERVQVHKRGTEFQYFSRSLKPVVSHKVVHFKEYIPKAFPSGDDLILDAEVLLIDTNTGKPLPFGTLGVHKKAKFEDANVCLFVFDCLHINGENLMDKPIKQRRKILHKNMTEIPNRIMFSEMKHISEPDDLSDLMLKVFREGLEGLVLKDVNSTYEPGKRHWLKVKKDYLHEGSMADSADLVCLGAYYGSGNKGGLMSVFLMGVYNPASKKWCTVTKVGNGFDDKTLDKLQKELDMTKISKDMSKVPSWLNIKKGVVPDFVIADPKNAPVWEIAGAEFSKSDIHTADGISIRFPRVTKVRDDKTWENATDYQRLQLLFKKSKEVSDLEMPGKKKGKSPKKSEKLDEDDGESTDTSSKQNGEELMDVDTGSSRVKSEPKSPAQKSPIKTGMKRKADDETEASPSKKAHTKPMCKYGTGCYQNNPSHLAKFDHPNMGDQGSPSKNKLEDIFTGKKIVLSSSLENYKQLKRYILSYDGDLVPEFSAGSATHVIVGPDQKPEDCGSAVYVSSEWVIECVKKKKLVSTVPYTV